MNKRWKRKQIEARLGKKIMNKRWKRGRRGRKMGKRVGKKTREGEDLLPVQGSAGVFRRNKYQAYFIGSDGG